MDSEKNDFLEKFKADNPQFIKKFEDRWEREDKVREEAEKNKFSLYD